MKPDLPSIQLCNADEATFWPWFRWPDFANWADKEHTVVVVPITGLADWGLTKSLDAEEAVLMAVMKEASLVRKPGLPLLVLPPIRFTLGPKENCAFPIDPDVACNLIEEIVGSVGAAGFSKVLLFNSSPWNEEICKAVGRDLRIGKKLQMFCVHLSSLGLDFNPARAGERRPLKAVIAALTAHAESAESSEGKKVLAETSARFASLLGEMRDRPALANAGNLMKKTWP